MTIRQQSRVALRLPVSIGGTQAAITTDLSVSGFQLETTALLREGTAVEGYVLHGEKELQWKGVVAWTRRGNPMASLWHSMGIRLTHVSTGLRALISMRARERAARKG
jgi:hypothetical protein